MLNIPSFKQVIDQPDDISKSVLPIEPSMPEQDETKKELEPYTADSEEQLLLLQELSKLADDDLSKIRLSIQNKLFYQIKELNNFYLLNKYPDTNDPTLYIQNENLFEHPLVFLHNLVGSIFSKIKVLLTLSLKDLKRSELRAWKNSNEGSFREILKKTLYELQNIKLSYPYGMEKINYQQALNRIDAVYTLLQMKHLSKTISTDINELIQIMSSPVSELQKNSAKEQKFNKITLSSPINMKSLKAVFIFVLDINKDPISAEKQLETSNEKRFQELFTSAQEFQNVYKQSLSMESYLQEVSGIYSTLQKIQEKVDVFITKIEQKQIELKKEYIGNIAKYLEDVASIFDIYSSTVYQNTRVEHNLVECMKKLKKHFRL
jgi:hypothetical protein